MPLTLAIGEGGGVNSIWSRFELEMHFYELKEVK